MERPIDEQQGSLLWHAEQILAKHLKGDFDAVELSAAMDDAYRACALDGAAKPDDEVFFLSAYAAVMLIVKQDRIFADRDVPDAPLAFRILGFSFVEMCAFHLSRRILKDIGEKDVQPVLTHPITTRNLGVQLGVASANGLQDMTGTVGFIVPLLLAFTKPEDAREPSSPGGVESAPESSASGQDSHGTALLEFLKKGVRAPAAPVRDGIPRRYWAISSLAVLLALLVGGLVVYVSMAGSASTAEGEVTSASPSPSPSAPPQVVTPPVPSRPPSAFVGPEVPNVTVRLLAFPSTPDVATAPVDPEVQSVSGHLPNEPLLTEIGTRIGVKVVVKTRDPAKPAPRDPQLSLGLDGGLALTMGSTRLFDADHPDGLPIADLTTAYRPISRSSDVNAQTMISFELAISNEGRNYFCGYTPRSITVYVTDNSPAVVDSLPIYVLKRC